MIDLESSTNMLFAKSLFASLKHSHHKVAMLSTLTFVRLLAIHGERNGDNDRRAIQSQLHQTE